MGINMAISEGFKTFLLFNYRITAGRGLSGHLYGNI